MSTELATLTGLAEEYARQALSPATLRAYKADWAHYLGWCRASGAPPLPATPETIAAYLVSMAHTHARATIERRLVSIGQAHKLAGLDWRSSHPTIRNTLAGLFRRHGRPQRKAAALETGTIKRLAEACTGSFTARRDRAIILLGYAGCLRRSEVAAITLEDLTYEEAGLRLRIPRSKTDGQNEGMEVGIPYAANPDTCPVRALQKWIEVSACEGGPVFRMVRADGTLMPKGLHPNSIGVIIQTRAAELGIKVSPSERLSAHGLRAGFITQAYRNGARDDDIMQHSRHRDLKTMRGYVRRAKLISGSPAKLLGL